MPVKDVLRNREEKDSLRQENESLKARVRYLEDKLEKLKKGSFGSSTPSSLIPFKENTRDRLYKWVENREVPADNNESEREIRLGVISREVSFGSQSIEGAKIRGRMMSIIYTMKKRGIDPVKRIKYALDELAKNRNKDPYKLLFHSKPPD